MLHLKVIDDTRYTSFIMFHHIVTQFLGKSATKMIESMEKVKISYTQI